MDRKHELDLAIPLTAWDKAAPTSKPQNARLGQSLERRIADLQARLRGGAPSNSSEPPSSGPLHVERRGRPGCSGRRSRHPQPGHEQHPRPPGPARAARRASSRCRPGGLLPLRASPTATTPSRSDTRSPSWARSRPDVIEYRLHRPTCRRCGVTARGRLPARASAGRRLRPAFAISAQRTGRRLAAGRERPGPAAGRRPAGAGDLHRLRRQAPATAGRGVGAADGPDRRGGPLRHRRACGRDRPARGGRRPFWLWVAAASGATAFSSPSLARP